jgi:hypothetical protein
LAKTGVEMKTDVQLKKDVAEELLWDPTVTDSAIVVSVSDGIVTLSGTVPHYAEKYAAERATQRVEGVKAIAEEMEVHIVGAYDRKDSEIAEAVVNSLKFIAGCRQLSGRCQRGDKRHRSQAERQAGRGESRN